MKTKIGIVLILAALSANAADDDIKFVYEVCLRGMATETSVPRADSSTLCSCAANKVKKSITQKQRSSIQDARNRMHSGLPIPPDMFQKTGLKALVQTSQTYCMDALWPVPPEISDEYHKRYSLIANQSVDQFNTLLDTHCKKYSKSKERSQCLVDVSREWINTKGEKYIGVPTPYITGNDLAKKFIEDRASDEGGM